MYGGYYGYGYYFDPTYFLVLIGLVLCLGASALVNSTMRKYSKVRNMRGITGAEAARNLLNREGLYNVQIECLNANDGDHYDPRTDTVRLSYKNYNGTSVTAVSLYRWLQASPCLVSPSAVTAIQQDQTKQL